MIKENLLHEVTFLIACTVNATTQKQPVKKIAESSFTLHGRDLMTFSEKIL
jgi:hypothetical protein